MSSPTAATAEPTPIGVDYVVRSDLLGNFVTKPQSVMEFPHGLLGFPECHRFALVRAGTDGVYWLQSLDHSTLVFLLVDPFPHFADYVVDLPPAEVLELGGGNAADLAVLTIVTLPPPGANEPPTTNLQGPVMVNLRARRGKQIICSDADHGVRRPLTLGDRL
jgi:flagellar assembly factor FliW